MKLTQNRQFKDVIAQATRNADQVFGLFSSIRKEIGVVADLAVQESTDSARKLGREWVKSGSMLSDEALHAAKAIVDGSVQVLFAKQGKQVEAANPVGKKPAATARRAPKKQPVAAKKATKASAEESPSVGKAVPSVKPVAEEKTKVAKAAKKEAPSLEKAVPAVKPIAEEKPAAAEVAPR